MSAWQPIETAPKAAPDQEYISILLYEPGVIMYVGGWDCENQVWVDMAVRADDEYQLENRPTHWMPLPEPPK